MSLNVITYAMLIDIEANHDFNKCVARHVVLSNGTQYQARQEAETWAKDEIQAKLACEAIDDPENTDIHSFSSVIRCVSWHYQDTTK